MGEREMSQNKSLQSKMPLAMGLAFVAFTTQFGGGFASGAQIYQYFINYGIWCLILPAVTQGLYALFFWYGMRYAYKHKTYDYRSFSDSMYEVVDKEAGEKLREVLTTEEYEKVLAEGDYQVRMKYFSWLNPYLEKLAEN